MYELKKSIGMPAFYTLQDASAFSFILQGPEQNLHILNLIKMFILMWRVVWKYFDIDYLKIIWFIQIPFSIALTINLCYP